MQEQFDSGGGGATDPEDDSGPSRPDRRTGPAPDPGRTGDQPADGDQPEVGPSRPDRRSGPAPDPGRTGDPQPEPQPDDHQADTVQATQAGAGPGSGPDVPEGLEPETGTPERADDVRLATGDDLRHQVADQYDGVEADDVRIVEEGGQATVEFDHPQAGTVPIAADRFAEGMREERDLDEDELFIDEDDDGFGIFGRPTAVFDDEREEVAEQMGVDPRQIVIEDVDDDQVEFGLVSGAQREMVAEQVDQQREAFADELGVDPDQIDVTDANGGIQFEPTEEAVRELEAEDAGVDVEDVEITDDGEVVIEEERETAAGRWLERRADTVSAGAEWVGEGIESAVPDVEVGSSATFGQGGLGVTYSDMAGAFGEFGVEALNVPSHALFTADATRAITEGRRPMGPGVTPGPGGHIAETALEADEIAADAGEALYESFEDDPGRFTGRAIGGALATVVAPTAAFRGARAASRGISRAAPSEQRILSGTGRERGQMELTITRERQRQRPRDQPADPTATTPEGRAPPREAFPSDAAYQQALRRHEERIVQEMVDETPAIAASPSQTPVDRVRSMRDEFASHAEYQRELQRAREQMQRRQRQRRASGEAPGMLRDDELTQAGLRAALPTASATAEATAFEDTDSLEIAGFDTPDEATTAAMEESTVRTMDEPLVTGMAEGTATTTATSTMFDQPAITTTAMDEPMLTTTITTTQRTPTRPRGMLPPTFGDDDEDGGVMGPDGLASPEITEFTDPLTGDAGDGFGEFDDDFLDTGPAR